MLSTRQSVFLTFAIFFTTFATLSFAQSAKLDPDSLMLQSLMKRKIACDLFSNARCNFYGKTETVRNAAYYYTFFLTDNFHEVEQKGFSDTDKYVSADKKCLIMFWPGQTIEFPRGKIDKSGNWVKWKPSDITNVDKAINQYIDQIIKGQNRVLGDIKISDICKGVDGLDFQISATGHDDRNGFILKVLISEYPVSGDMIVKNFLYKYDLNEKTKYEALGKVMANYYHTGAFNDRKININTTNARKRKTTNR